MPRRWPYACPSCGLAADPKFAEPWAHDARGFELQHWIDTGVDTAGIANYEIFAWRYKDAVLRGDQQAARQARADFWVHDESSVNPHARGSNGYLLVHYAIEAGDLPSAADHLLHWLNVSRADGNDGERVNCKTVLSATVLFFDAPGSFAQPQAAAIKDRAMTLGAEAEDYLAHPTIVGLERLLRAP